LISSARAILSGLKSVRGALLDDALEDAAKRAAIAAVDDNHRAGRWNVMTLT
jgi:hypothetical protein